MRQNETLSYMIYMANKWSEIESIRIFGEDLGKHIWNKYLAFCEDHGMYGAYSMFVFELSSNNLELLLNRACELYNGRTNKNYGL